jgi:hypothetical protein
LRKSIYRTKKTARSDQFLLEKAPPITILKEVEGAEGAPVVLWQ